MQLFDFIKVVWNGWSTLFITNKWSKSDINPWIIKNSEMTHKGELQLKKSWEPKTDLGLIVNWKCFCFSAISLRKPVRIISSFFPTGYKFLGAWEFFFLMSSCFQNHRITVPDIVFIAPIYEYWLLIALNDKAYFCY